MDRRGRVVARTSRRAKSDGTEEGARWGPHEDALDEFIDAAAARSALPVEPEWKPGIKANLQVTLRVAAMVAEFELPDEAEPAPVFEA